jgi:hypothetical protein
MRSHVRYTLAEITAHSQMTGFEFECPIHDFGHVCLKVDFTRSCQFAGFDVQEFDIASAGQL